MDFKEQARPAGKPISLPLVTKTRRGSRVIIYAFFPQQQRPWIGCYSPFDNDSESPEYVPMSWMADGRFDANTDGVGTPRVSGADVPELGEIYKQITQ